MCLMSYRGGGVFWDVSFAPFGMYFATGNSDGSTCIYRTDHVHPLRILCGHLSDVNVFLFWFSLSLFQKVLFHPNCNYVISSSSYVFYFLVILCSDHSLRLWDVVQGECVRITSTHQTSCLAISPLGNVVACGDIDGVSVFDLSSGKKVKSFTGSASCLSFSNDGNVLFSGSLNNCISTWDMKTDTKSEFFTKNTPIRYVRCTSDNIVVGAGIYSL